MKKVLCTLLLVLCEAALITCCVDGTFNWIGVVFTVFFALLIVSAWIYDFAHEVAFVCFFPITLPLWLLHKRAERKKKYRREHPDYWIFWW